MSLNILAENERKAHKQWLTSDRAKELIEQKEKEINHLPFENIKSFIRQETTEKSWQTVVRVERAENIEKIYFDSFDSHSVEYCLELDLTTQEKGYIKAKYYNKEGNFFIEPFETRIDLIFYKELDYHITQDKEQDKEQERYLIEAMADYYEAFDYQEQLDLENEKREEEFIKSAFDYIEKNKDKEEFKKEFERQKALIENKSAFSF